MEVYFVRHGQTGGNVARRHQAPDTPLTPAGKQQAALMAKEVAALQPTHLIASSNLRALETARFIAKETGLDIDVDERFIELRRPTFLYGHYQRSWRSILVYVGWYFGVGQFGERSERGETYREFRERLHEVRKYLNTYPPETRLVVVSHAVFIVFFIAHLNRERRLGPLDALRAFKRILTIKNASVTKIVLD